MNKVPWSTKPYLRWLTLLTSSTTLLCCTLPILLVMLGSGAFVAGLRYDWPFLIFLSEHKYWTLARGFTVGVAGLVYLASRPKLPKRA